MYLLATHIPFYLDGPRRLTDISWQRDLLLARDWLAPAFGGLTVLGPSLPIEARLAGDLALAPIGDGDGIRVVPSFDLRCRASRFWFAPRRRWMEDVRREVASAAVVHTSAVDDVFRPLPFLAHSAAVRAGVATVMVGPDMDPHVTLPHTLKGRLVGRVFDRLLGKAGRTADLLLLKEGLVFNRYSAGARNVKAFCHSMHRRADVIPEAALERRLATLAEPRPLRALYAGRFITRKGIADSIAAVAAAKRSGATIEYHLFGAGPDEADLRRRADESGVGDRVKFRGFVEYGPEFLARLAEFDVMLFMPTEEDTPRMLYDAMAAGVPLVGSRIPFLEHRASSDRMAELVAIGDAEGAGRVLTGLDADRARLADLSRRARTAGLRHALEEWYGRRMQWTMEAVRRKAAAGCQ